jgi:two-component system sensor histidine kinase FlrB
MGEPSAISSLDPRGLEQAFGVFNELSSRLTDAYGQLEAQVAALTAELASARSERLHERAQKEHLADQLGVLLEALPAAVVLIDVRDRVDRFNPAAEQLFPALAWGRRWGEIQREAVDTEPSPGDWRLRDGRCVSVSQRPLSDRGRILVLVDVTDQRRLRERVERQDRLGAMGEMAAQLAHQIRTPLATSVLYAGQLGRDGLDGAQRRQFADQLLGGLRHTENLVREMLAFSRGGNLSTTPMRLPDAVEIAFDGLAPRLRQLDVGVEQDLQALRGVWMRGNLDALAGAVRNLVDNALDHAGHGARIAVRGQLAPHGDICLIVEDDGPGIDHALLTRIFDPFFTTRDRGTGLGLAVVQAVVLEHDGVISAGRSTLGGARFELHLPVLADPDAAPGGTVTQHARNPQS